MSALAAAAAATTSATLRGPRGVRSLARRGVGVGAHTAKKGRMLTFSCKASVKDELNDVTPMMLASSAVSAIGTGCAVFALATSAETTAMLVAESVGIESMEMVEMEYSSSVKSAPAITVAVAEEDDYQKSGQDLFDCEIASLRCNA